MNKLSKEEFNWVWKGTSREGILNQFYYEHYELIKLQQKRLKLKLILYYIILVLNIIAIGIIIATKILGI